MASKTPKFQRGDQIEICPLRNEYSETCKSFHLYGEIAKVCKVFAITNMNEKFIGFRYILTGNEFVPKRAWFREDELRRIK